MATIKRALISVSDKSGILELAQALTKLNVEILSTGGTAKLFRDNNIPVVEVSDYTGFTEMLDGRVKTLHPKVHGGILGRRDLPEHVSAMKAANIPNIDMVVVNLYPFEATVAQPNCTLEDAIENIDIGGPAMVRSAAKNWKDVAVLTDANQYAGLISELQSTGGAVSQATQFALSIAAFNRISNYDGAISDYLSSFNIDGSRSAFPAQTNGRFIKLQDLRYGENPHQQAAFYRDLNPAPGSLVTAVQLQGKELSYNNIADGDAASNANSGFSKEWLQKAADPNRVGRYLISVEKAQDLLSKMNAVDEAKIKGADGKACWDGYRYNGTAQGKDKCVKVSESVEDIMDNLINKIITNEAIQNNRR